MKVEIEERKYEKWVKRERRKQKNLRGGAAVTTNL